MPLLILLEGLPQGVEPGNQVFPLGGESANPRFKIQATGC